MKLDRISENFIVDAVFEPGEIICSASDLVLQEQERRKLYPDIFPIDDGLSNPLTPEHYENLGYQYIATSNVAEPSELAIRASESLFARTVIDRSEIDILIYYDTNPHVSETLHNISTKVVAKLGLSNVSFSIHSTQKNCTSALFAVEIASAMLNSNPQYKYALVTGGDCIDFKGGQPRVVNGQIHADAGSAILLGRDGRKITYLKNKTRPIAWKRFCSPRSEFDEIIVKYLSWSLMELNRAKNVNAISKDNICYLATNQKLVEQYFRKNDIPDGSISFYREHVAQFGNSQCHQIVHALEKILQGIDTECLLHATGLGSTMSTMVIERKQLEQQLS